MAPTTEITVKEGWLAKPDNKKVMSNENDTRRDIRAVRKKKPVGG